MLRVFVTIIDCDQATRSGYRSSNHNKTGTKNKGNVLPVAFIALIYVVMRIERFGRKF